MKTYYLKWFDKDYDEVVTMIINESQKRLIDFMREHLPIDDMLIDNNISITITEEDESAYYLADYD